MAHAFPRRSALRKTLAATFGAVSLFALGTTAAFASPATDFVTSFGDKLVSVVNSNAPLAEKKQEVLPLLRQNVDVDGIGRYCLGRYWKSATPEQQQKYLSLFDRVLVNTITDQVGSYQGVHFRVTGSSPAPDGERVEALLDRPGQPEAKMELIVGGSPLKVIDLYGEGASLRMNQRGDYSSYLGRHGGNVDALNQALEHQLSAHR